MTFGFFARETQKSLKITIANELKRMLYKPVIRDGFIYAKGTVPVLLIAHMDTVHRKPVKTICYSADGTIAMSPEGIGGDDRAGVYAIMEIIKQHRCHVLFCEDEEKGGIGANKFIKQKIAPKVNYIVEIDRHGSNDAVFYDCDNPEFTKFVTSFGFEEEFGTFSDISVVAPDLGIAAVNISAGYYNEHTQHEYVDLNALKNNIKRIGQMVSTESKKFEYIECKRYSKYYDFSDFRKSSTSSKEIDDDDEDETLRAGTSIITLMELYSPNYVVNPDHEMEDCDGEYLIDADGRVYTYDYEENHYIEADGYQAFREQGLPAIFKAEFASPYLVTCDDYAFLKNYNRYFK